MKETETTENEVMSYKGLSVYLKLSQGNLRQKVMNGRIPFFKIDGAVRFSKKKIDAWLEEHGRGAKRRQADNSGGLFTDGGSGEI